MNAHPILLRLLRRYCCRAMAHKGDQLGVPVHGFRAHLKALTNYWVDRLEFADGDRERLGIHEG